jgi:hypothetical protein
MDKDVFSLICRNKTIPLAIVEPFHCALSHKKESS